MRFLQACPSCHGQYDVSDIETGEMVKCACGEAFSVVRRKPRDPRALCCSNCGACLKEESRQCEYCRAEVTLDEKRLDSLCPDCGARMASDASYCMNCGVRIAPQAVQSVLGDKQCPRCQSGMQTRDVGEFHLIECRFCAGLWLGPDTISSLTERAEDDPQVLAVLEGGPKAHDVDCRRAAYLPCIGCREMMVPRNFGGTSGVVLDYCKDHGIWLDHGELERILSFVRGGGLVDARRKEVRRLEKKVADARNQARESVLSRPVHGPPPFTTYEPQRTVLTDTVRLFATLFGGV